jgi:hypothetical protein
MGTSGTPAPATPSPAPAAGGGNASPSLPVALKVDFTLITPDGNRKIGFTLEKDSDGTNTTWTITFTLYEKQAGATTFGDPMISLNVTVSSTLHANAQTAATNGLTAAQTAHATGPAADASKALANGEGTHLAAANSIQNTLK